MDAAALALSARSDPQPPPGLTEVLRVLWLARADRWHEAHDACQNLPDPAGAWIHAWLHRQEGDFANARYWYERARKPAPDSRYSLEKEWFEIANSLAG